MVHVFQQLIRGVQFASVHVFQQLSRGVQFASVHVLQQLIRGVQFTSVHVFQQLNRGVQFTAVQLGAWVVSVTMNQRRGLVSVNFGLVLMLVDHNLFSVTFKMTGFNVR